VTLHREEGSTHRPTVLVCEDEASLREFVRMVVGPGFHFAETGDGLEASELARKLRPDIVVLDLMLPGKHGLEVLRDIRQDSDLSHTRVVAITAGNVTEESVLAEGADRLLRKPFEPGDLKAAVEELLAA
jgi:two-component system, OmpR family, response regulator MtrA